MKIQNKLFLVFFSLSLLLVTALVLLIQWSIGKGMINYVNTKELEALKPITATLAQEYNQKDHWLSMKNKNNKFLAMIFEQLDGSEFIQPHRAPHLEHDGRRRHPADLDELRTEQPQSRRSSEIKREPPPRRGPKRGEPRPRDINDDLERRPPPEDDAFYALLDTNNKLIVGRYLKQYEYTKTPIELDDIVIGYLAVSKRNQLTQGYEIDFIEKQQTYLWLIALVAMFFVTLATMPLARHLVEPIRLLSSKMHKLTQGDYQQSIEVTRQDELGQVARDFNELALTLTENETARKRWLANISHELRTPVAILRAELEAMLDNVRPLSKENINSATDEVKHLQRLIDDLNLLTSADIGGMSYRKQAENLPQLLLADEDKYRTYLANAGIKLSLVLTEQDIDIYADKTRFQQLFENILNNCVKYSSATKLTISLDVEQINNEPMAILKFEDNGIGVDEHHLPHLFEHLYRTDDSRNRKTGGAGLGLSICRLIVIAHQGEIKAEHSASGGLTIVVTLPVALI